MKPHLSKSTFRLCVLLGVKAARLEHLPAFCRGIHYRKEVISGVLRHFSMVVDFSWVVLFAIFEEKS